MAFWIMIMNLSNSSAAEHLAKAKLHMTGPWSFILDTYTPA
jgi:hypothetical protein